MNQDGLRSPLAERKFMNIATPPPPSVSTDARKSRTKSLAFNFDSVTASPPAKVTPVPQRRRGHHHKHSLSHQFFLPPVQRAPLALPASFPIPNWGEVLKSSTTDQCIQLLWATFHLLIGFGVMKYNTASLAVSSLSKCITFDAFGIASTTVFKVLEQYPVWTNSSIKHPFGLKRAEVIVRFASAVYLTYSGVELIREVVERLIIGGGHGHGPTDEIHIDPHALNTDFMPISMMATIFITVFAAVMFGNHSQLSQVMDLDTFPRMLRNPFYLLTILPAAALLAITMMDLHLHGFVDRSIALGIAAALMYIGLVLTFRLGSILLMTYPSSSVAALFDAVENDDSVAHVEGKVWQVWTGLVVVSMRVSVRGGESVETRVRERIVRYTRDVLGGGYGSGKSIRFEVKVECDRV
ncbi:Cation efflux family protein family [Taphrina deformans PYCC 5710]|uniref:Cation efflux family protein family n=1 Tax=Taphrina deformans (strain PYCC 5710 / ATCC 11124 / CBS 356.35 / IMI 108563 / JCM 9778 / NBRC 8474) TaxID=1097556 RepID=R4X7S3_TAPDE|nr:Cation efflux family protein family [Taphrina deformans PYCC 5710]|eukprot:CCG81496.1 Cation efflux family protein family [Taphrina deformans PYCC 5710]